MQNVPEPRARSDSVIWRQRTQLGDWGFEAIHGIAGSASSGSTARMTSGSGRTPLSTTAKAREALWAAMCFKMSVADRIGLSQILFMLIACPQSLHVIKVSPAMFLVVLYMP